MSVEYRAMEMQSLQELIEPGGVCFGCGPRNAQGLHIRSYPDPDGIHVTANIMPKKQYCGWPGMVYGGFLAMLVDCHSNYTAMAGHYRAAGRLPGSLPAFHCVTGKLGISYLKPTPLGVPLFLKARIEGAVGRKTRVLCDVYAGDLLTAKGDSFFYLADPKRLAAEATAVRGL